MNPLVMPYIDCAALTLQAVADCLAQTLSPFPILLIDNGSQDEGRGLADDLMRAHPDRILTWHHLPPFPSLSTTWNRALRFCWEAGADHALVVNNDVRLAPWTYELLLEVQQKTGGGFVTAVGVKEEQFALYQQQVADDPAFARVALGIPTESRKDGIRPEGYSYGGPDFSCFLITKACHTKYQFDEGFVPAYHEDCDFHRRMMLGGDGTNIFGVNIPFLHYGSATTNRSPEHARAFSPRFEQCKQYYIRKWGGSVGAEQFIRPADATSIRPGASNPELQAWVAAGRGVRELLGDGVHES